MGHTKHANPRSKLARVLKQSTDIYSFGGVNRHIVRLEVPGVLNSVHVWETVFAVSKLILSFNVVTITSCCIKYVLLLAEGYQLKQAWHKDQM